MSHERYKRLGLIAELEEKLKAVERRLKGIHGSLTDAAFAIESHLDTDGASVKQFAQEYFDCQQEGIAIRKRLEELKNS